MKHRALLVGAGRIGVGRNWIETPYVYTHAGAYKALSDRVELVGVVDSSIEAARWAEDKWGVEAWTSIEGAVAKLKPDIVSICTPPDKHAANLVQCLHDGLLGVWMEKPMNVQAIDQWGHERWPGLFPKVQVNYIRRFDDFHRFGKADELWVWAKKDVHTVCHFTDLARLWEVPKSGLHYFHMDGPNSYVARRGETDRLFPLGGMTGGFMERALGNLLDAVEGKAELISPPESAIESEKWAEAILKGTP